MAKQTEVKAMTKTELFKGLNEGQLEAVKTIDGPIQICAVAGAGKTKVLTTRTAYMINHLKIAPEQLAIMTFTKKAATEMEDRIKTMVSKKDFEKMFCGTSHSFGYGILAKELPNINDPKDPNGIHRDLADFASRKREKNNPGVLMNAQQGWFGEKVKESLMKDFTIEKDVKEALKSTKLKALLSFVGVAKNQGIDHHEYLTNNAQDATAMQWAYIYFYQRYEMMKLANRAIDGDDMLFLAVRLFRKHPHLLKKYQDKYEYVMIDETQDNNPTQYELAQMIAFPQNNIFVVGDDDQSMYGFRGAAPDLFVEFAKLFPNVKQIPLELNYRSAQDILHKANKLIAYNKNRIVKQLKSGKKDKAEKAVFYTLYDNEAEEGKGIAKEVETLRKEKGIQYKDMFVLYRTNAQTKDVEDALITAGIPYVVHGGFSFYDRKEVKDIVSYLKLVLNNDDDEAFERVYNTPSRFVGKAFLTKLTIKGYSKWQASDYANLTPTEKTAVRSIKTMVNSMKKLKEDGEKTEELIRYLMENGYEEHLNKNNDGEDDESLDQDTIKRENLVIEKIINFANRFKTLEQFIQYTEQMTNKKKTDINGIQLMTTHKSKGLEASVVFAIGINEGLMPHFRAIEKEESGDDSAIEEERRIAYVAGTRAEQRYYPSSTKEFNGNAMIPSRFIYEMELIDENDGEDDKEEDYEALEAMEDGRHSIGYNSHFE